MGRVRNERVQKSSAVAKCRGKLIEGLEAAAARNGSRFLQPDLAQLARKGRMGLGLSTDDVHIFQSGATIEPKVRQVLTEKSETLAKKETRDQRAHDDRNQRVAAAEGFDRRFGRQSTAP